ncbi:hypothetical protein QBC44DRAFT_278540 [Cladorrhinum sp. PSN332]|nr:hypothetical protein QBC44DRAFT_278540 [Cladorrhinum sp. PSN332]
MADPLSITAGILAVVEAACTSAKALYDLINGLKNAPKLIRDMNREILEVQGVLRAVSNNLNLEDPGKQRALASIFQDIGLGDSIDACYKVTQDFLETIKKYTAHSNNRDFDRRDRLTVTFRKSKLSGFQKRLNASKDTVQFAMTAATLLTASSTCATNEDLSPALRANGDALKSQSLQLDKIEKELKDLDIDSDDGTGLRSDDDDDIIPITAGERDLTLNAVLPVLKRSCRRALEITEAQGHGTYQRFGGVVADGFSKVGAGMAGSNFGGGRVYQEFKDTTATNGGQAFVGRMDIEAFKIFWGGPVARS